MVSNEISVSSSSRVSGMSRTVFFLIVCRRPAILRGFLLTRILLISYTLAFHKISSPEAYRAVYKALHGIFTGLSLVTLGEIQEK